MADKIILNRMKKVKLITFAGIMIIIGTSIVYFSSSYISGEVQIEKYIQEFGETPSDNREEALKSVAKELLGQGEKKKWKGWVQIGGINSKVGMEEEIRSMMDKIVGILTLSTDRFQLIASEEEEDRIMRTIERMITSGKIEWFNGGRVAAIQKYIGKGKLPDFLLSCELNPEKVKEEVIITSSITCSLTDQKTFTAISSSASFYHPDYTLLFVRYQAERNDAIKKTKVIRFYSLWIGAGAIVGVLMMNMVFFMWRRAFITRREEEMEKVKGYIRTGQFIAADKVITKALFLYPGDPDFSELRGRLDIVIGKASELRGDKRISALKKAEEAAFITSRIKQLIADGKIREAIELYEPIKEKEAFNPELKMLTSGLEKEKEILTIEKEVEKKIQPIKELIEKRKLFTAEKLLKALRREYPSSRIVSEYLAEITDMIEKGNELHQKGLRLLAEGKPGEGLGMLKSALNGNREIKDIQEIIESVERAKGVTSISLFCSTAGESLTLLCEGEILVGRENTHIVLNDLKVSRKHLKILFQDEKVIVEDMGSRNGTFVNGKDVKMCEIKDGDRLNIGGAAEFIVRVFTEDEIAGVVLTQGNHHYGIIRESIPITFNPVGGIEFKENAENKVVYRKPFFMLKTGEEYKLLLEGQSISLGSVEFLIKNS